MTFTDRVAVYVEQAMAAETAQIEATVVVAVTLHDFDRLDRIRVVHYGTWGEHWGVASWIGPVDG